MLLNLKIIFGEKFTKLVYLQQQQQHEQITIQQTINIKVVSWKCTNAVGNENKNQAMMLK